MVNQSVANQDAAFNADAQPIGEITPIKVDPFELKTLLDPGDRLQAIRHLKLGRSTRHLWTLNTNSVPLNHGAFGACPLYVQNVQRQITNFLESSPDRFFDECIIPSDQVTPLRGVIARLGEFVDASPVNLALVENATVGIGSVLRSISLEQGDRVLITNHSYAAVKLAVEDRCRLSGAQVDVVDLPITSSDDDIVARIQNSLTTQTRLAVIDHITSSTALVLPIRQITALCRGNRVPILVDGAHAVGQLPLSLRDIGSDWYVSNAHKWLYAPRGACFLYASDDVASFTRPSFVSHFIGLGFPRAFDFVGTRDYSPWLTIPAGIDFHLAIGTSRIASHARHILDHATAKMTALGATAIGPDNNTCWMRSFHLPQRRNFIPEDITRLREQLWREHRIQASIQTFENRLLLRISAQAYVDEEDIDLLQRALARDGWPGKT